MLLHLQAGLPSGCVPYSVKNSNSDQKKCPQACELSGFDRDTDADKRARPPLALRPAFKWCPLASNADSIFLRAQRMRR